MGKKSSPPDRLREILTKDPRTAILLHEILGPPRGLVLVPEGDRAPEGEEA